MKSSQIVLSFLQEKGAISVDKRPMESGQHDLTGGVPIIDIPNAANIGAADFILYSSVTTPNGTLLIQAPGRAYHGTIDGDELLFETQKLDSDHPFGEIGRYPNNYYLANRKFLDDLVASRLYDLS